MDPRGTLTNSRAKERMGPKDGPRKLQNAFGILMGSPQGHLRAKKGLGRPPRGISVKGKAYYPKPMGKTDVSGQRSGPAKTKTNKQEKGQSRWRDQAMTREGLPDKLRAGHQTRCQRTAQGEPD